MSEKKENSEVIQITKRQASLITGSFVLLTAGVFAGGYFLGAYHAIDPFVARVEQDSFADQVYASLNALYDGDVSKAEVTPAVEVIEVEVVKTVPLAEQENAQMVLQEVLESSPDNQEGALPEQEVIEARNPALENQKSEESNIEKDEYDDDRQDDKDEMKGAIDSFELVKATNDKQSKRWHAQLIGYGFEKSARDFAQKLTKKGFDVTVTARTSRSTAGNQRTWYQVVTAAYENRDQLQKQVDKIVSLEKLKGVQISVC